LNPYFAVKDYRTLYSNNDTYSSAFEDVHMAISISKIIDLNRLSWIDEASKLNIITPTPVGNSSHHLTFHTNLPSRSHNYAVNYRSILSRIDAIFKSQKSSLYGI